MSMKKIGSLAGLLLLIVILTCLPAMAAEVSVNVRVEGAEETLYRGEVICTGEGPFTVYDVLTELDRVDNGVEIEGLEYGYITAINDERAGQTERGWDGFGIRMGNRYVPYDQLISTYVYSGVSLVIYYADEFGAGLLVPKLDSDNIFDGILTVYAEADKGSKEEIIPVSGAEVRWYCGDSFASYTTDEFGRVSIHPSFLTTGEHQVTVTKINEEGVPLLLRPANPTTVRVSTAVGDSRAIYVAAAMMAAGALGFAVLLLWGRQARKKRECVEK